MQEKINGDELLSKINIVDVVERRGISLRKKGGELHGLCPFHDDTKTSLQVNERKQIFSCFACGKSGDAIEFLRLYGLTFHEAVKEINGGELTDGNIQVTQAKKKQEPQYTQIRPIPGDAPKVTFKHYLHGEPSKIWEYKEADGTTCGYVCRFDLTDGTKEVLPLVYATNGEKKQWRYLGFSKPRPLYNLQEIFSRPDATVLVVEGEKTAEAARILLPKTVVTTWIGGSNGVEHTDWTPLKNRKILYWPDNDLPGVIAMYHVHELTLESQLAKMIKNPTGAPKGWDIADATDWNPETAVDHVRKTADYFREPDTITFTPEIEKQEGKPARVWIHKENIFGWFEFRGAREWRTIKVPAQNIPEKPPIVAPIEPRPVSKVNIPEPPENAIDEKNAPFKFLGFDKSESGVQNFWFYVNSSKTTVKLSAGAMSTANLFTLAPLQWWEIEFPSKGKADFDSNSAVNYLINVSNQHGAFKPRNIRGRGAWMDAGRVVLHSGNNLIVDGVPMRLGTLKSKFIYETSEEIGFNIDNPLAAGRELVEMLSLINWERPINAYLLAGWCVIAPVCGALSWRPHVWLTGPAGSGKSWVFQKIVRPLLSVTGVAVQSETTEAGIRQILQHDALPVVFDEAEGEDMRAAERMERVLALMRAASSDDGGILAKGTPGGGGKTFVIRSCFAFASISVQVKHQSDRGRVTILGINNYPDGDATKEERWKKLQAQYAALINDEYINALQARTIKLLPTIIDNAKTFSAAAAAEIGGQRAGDQLGALLAGAYSLFSGSKITYEAAVEWIQKQGNAWNEEKSVDKMKDENSLLSYLLEQAIRLDNGNYRTIGEVIISSAGFNPDDVLNHETANDLLKRYGFKYDRDDDIVIISNSSKEIHKILERTAWSKNHNKILMRIPGAYAMDSVRFSTAISTRAVAIPARLILMEKGQMKLL